MHGSRVWGGGSPSAQAQRGGGAPALAAGVRGWFCMGRSQRTSAAAGAPSRALTLSGAPARGGRHLPRVRAVSEAHPRNTRGSKIRMRPSSCGLGVVLRTSRLWVRLAGPWAYAKRNFPGQAPYGPFSKILMQSRNSHFCWPRQKKQFEDAPLKTAGFLPPKRENRFQWRSIAARAAQKPGCCWL